MVYGSVWAHSASKARKRITPTPRGRAAGVFFLVSHDWSKRPSIPRSSRWIARLAWMRARRSFVRARRRASTAANERTRDRRRGLADARREVRFVVEIDGSRFIHSIRFIQSISNATESSSFGGRGDVDARARSASGGGRRGRCGGGRERGAREESDDATAYERRDDGDGDGDGEEAAEAGGGKRARAWTRGGGRTMVGRFRD